MTKYIITSLSLNLKYENLLFFLQILQLKELFIYVQLPC